jgi:hypothetical protein
MNNIRKGASLKDPVSSPLKVTRSKARSHNSLDGGDFVDSYLIIGLYMHIAQAGPSN